jgi:C1A family cysteine protease
MIPMSFAHDADFDNLTADNDDALSLNPGDEILEADNDYYFDVNADDSGNGTCQSPFKDFTVDMLVENSTVHFAKGEYVFAESRTFNNMSFYGADSHDTVLNGNGTTLTINGTVSFKNLTLTNFRIVNQGNLNASNTRFTELLPSAFGTDNINYYGGAIAAFQNKNIYLDGCFFFNNTAHYGGAFYVAGGNLTVLNSVFISNTAELFGGAIIGDDRVRIIIRNTRFICNAADDDAGGALYLINSYLDAKDSEISNSSGTFGAGITSLNSHLTLNNMTFKGNVAKYDGGAVYQLYGSLNIDSSKFIANTARNGAGLFIDGVDVGNITSNEFIANNASLYAGAIYSFFNDDFNLSSNLFVNNTAELYDDFYSLNVLDLIFADGNCSSYVLNQTFNSTIPSQYDLRDYGWVTSVKNQQKGGNCWAFAALGALESCVLKASGEVLDLSEENMKNLMAYYSDYGFRNRNTNNGGVKDMAVAYLASWLGPVDENEDRYDDKGHLSPLLKDVLHVQNILYLKRDNYTDNDAIKQAILNYGAVATNMYYLNNNANLNMHYTSDKKLCYYYGGDAGVSSNHAVTIVGWDDSVSVPNAPGKGAWIVKNSWGPDWFSSYGGDGYFYVSYYDVAFAKPGNYKSYTFILNDTQHFDKNYQYEFVPPTDYFYVNQTTVWYENAFTATDNEFLAGVATYFNKDTVWELFIYVNSRLQLVQNGSGVPGYFTFNLDYPIPVVKGDIFEIVFKIIGDENVGFPIYEPGTALKFSQSPRTSFVSLDGVEYFDLYNLYHEYPGHWYYNQVASIKGFTQLITLNSSSGPLNITYDSLDLFNITLDLFDENRNPIRNGNVVFTVNGVNHTVRVSEGLAFLQVPFALGINNISWSFLSPNYYPISGNGTFEVPPIRLDMNITVLQDSNSAYVNFTFSQQINENLTVTVNGVNQTVEAINGIALLDLIDLDYGEYNITASVDKEVFDSHNSTAFFVNFKRTYILAGNLETVYNSGVSYSVQLFDQFNASVIGREVRFIVGDNVYLNMTDENGTATVAIALKDGVYRTEMVFEGDGSYLKSGNSSLITVKSSIILPTVTKYAMNSNYEVYLVDKSGNPLNSTAVSVNANGKNYNVKTDANGKAIFVIPFTLGKFAVAVVNPDTSEKSSQEITVSKRITENRDMSFYYGNAPVYKVRVCDDNGQFKSGLNVKLTVGGKSYSLKTDKDGYVSYGLNLACGKHSVTVEYKGFRTSNKITVKPTLITKNKSFKKGKKIKYQAKLLNKKGKALKGKKITFKFKGKKYTAKTNRKGIAKITINKKYKVGKYKITAAYKKLKSSSRITIKK